MTKDSGKMHPKLDASTYRINPGSKVELSKLPTSETGPFSDKEDSLEEFEYHRARIEGLQERLWAEHRQSFLVVLQAIDTGGKDGTIRAVFGGVNPQGCVVTSFKQPTPLELDHDFLWRIEPHAPARGQIGIFNRSHYEDVLAVRVHDLVPKSVWKQRYEQINAFEKRLAANRTTILKFFLHISREEQRERLQARLDDPEKRWKFAISDLEDRKHWDEFQDAFQDAIANCSTKHAPWYVIPADRKWFRNVVIAGIVADTLEQMDPQYPDPEKGLDDVVIPV